MEKNMGSIDRIIRIVLSIVIVLLFFAGQITGTAAVIPGIIAVASLATGATGVCPLYLPLKFSTKKKEE